MNIRKVADSEIPILIEMVGALLNEIMATMNQPYFKFEYEHALNQAYELIDEGKYFALMAWQGDKPVGVITAYESYALYAEGAYGTIPECYVLTQYRGDGVGKRLIEEMVEFAKRKHWQRLEVTTPPLPEFEGSLKFYEQNGFEVSGGKKLKRSL